MSLVVAAIHDDDQITMVADTKISFFDRQGHADEARARRTYSAALPKIMLLRPDLMVGVTGDDPDVAIKDLVAHRNDQPEALIDHVVGLTSAGFVVATHSPARLWSIDGGVIDERTQVGRAWSGDRSAYDLFRQKWQEWPPETLDVPFLLTSSMQFLTSFDPVESVGGFTLVASTHSDGFRFQPLTNFVGPSDPRPFGALILKSAAYTTDSRDKERHLFDAAALLACIDDPFAERAEFTGSDRRRIATLATRLDGAHPAWRALPEDHRTQAQLTLELLGGSDEDSATGGPTAAPA